MKSFQEKEVPAATLQMAGGKGCPRRVSKRRGVSRLVTVGDCNAFQEDIRKAFQIFRFERPRAKSEKGVTFDCKLPGPGDQYAPQFPTGDCTSKGFQVAQ